METINQANFSRKKMAQCFFVRLDLELGRRKIAPPNFSRRRWPGRSDPWLSARESASKQGDGKRFQLSLFSGLCLFYGVWTMPNRSASLSERERERDKKYTKKPYRFAILFLLDTRHGLILHVGVPFCWLFEALIGSKCSNAKYQ